MKNKISSCLWEFASILLANSLIAFYSYFVWNTVLPSTLNIPNITYWDAWLSLWLVVLLRAYFKLTDSM